MSPTPHVVVVGAGFGGLSAAKAIARHPFQVTVVDRLTLHLVELIGFRNRAAVLVNWAWNYLTYDRGARIIADVDGPA